jgi:hypothetical protein
MKDYKAEIMYESQGKTPAGDPFMTVKQARGYYQYAERGGQDSIAFILFDANVQKFALILESKPPMDERMQEEVKMTTAFGGSIDMGDDVTYREICQTEVKEESGYVVPLENIFDCGKTLVSTQMSQLCNGFLVDVTGIEKTEIAEYETKDKNDEFNGNEVRWLDASEVMENNDWKSIWIMAKAISLGVMK